MLAKTARFLLVLIILALATYAILVWRSEPVEAHPFFNGDQEVLVIAHQGGNLVRPDNTMVAFEHAVELGVDVLEMDVSQTADGHIVVMHDLTVDRTTDGSGAIQAMTLAEIKALDAAYDWSIDEGQSFPYRGQGISVPVLEEVLTAFPDMRLNIEIKQSEPSMVVPFCQLLRRYGAEVRVLVASFHAETITEFREVCPEIVTSAAEPAIRLFYALNTAYLGGAYSPPGGLHAFQVPEYSGNIHVVTRRFVEGAHAHNIDVHVWTVNETDDMRRMLALGVDGIITDRPDLLLELLGR